MLPIITNLIILIQTLSSMTSSATYIPDTIKGFRGKNMLVVEFI